jgi:uncharacterized protein (DUF488 family)
VTLVKKSSDPRRLKEAWTIGYEGRTVDQFMHTLLQSGIEQVVDVRERPISRKNGFSKGALSQELWNQTILYHHIPELGTPSALRKKMKNGGSLERLLEGYARHLDKNERAYELLSTLIETRASAILCFERDYTACHRQILAKRLEMDGFHIMHL